MIIELSRGDFIKQPMFNQVTSQRNLDGAKAVAKVISEELDSNGFIVNRVKIEVPDFHATSFQSNPTRTTNYFEWHGKINYHQVSELNALCNEFSVHLSRNSLKNEADFRFITLREFGAQKTFQSRVAHLTGELINGGWKITKQQAEYCVFDSKVSLDNGWLTTQ